MIVEGWLSYVILFATGAAAGTVNVVAGGGSFIALPVMIFLGLPPTVANGTNRVAILVQNIGAVGDFRRRGILRWRWTPAAALPALVGAVIGTWAAVEIGEDAFRRILALLMIGAALWMIWNPLRRVPRETEAVESGAETGSVNLARPGLMLAFLVVGFYGGFVQAGTGFLILAVAAAAGLDLVRGNALKVLVILCYTPVALAIFTAHDKVDWGMGMALAAGTLVGGLTGVALTVRLGHRWIRRVVTVLIVVLAIRLLLG